MTDLPPSPKLPPLSFALGSLTAQVTNLAAEQSLSRSAYEALPERVVAILSPRFVAAENTIKDHEVRLKALEKVRWQVGGGFVIILTIIGVVLGHPLK